MCGHHLIELRLEGIGEIRRGLGQDDIVHERCQVIDRRGQVISNQLKVRN